MTTVSCLNIRHGGGKRQRAIGEWLTGTGADVFVLTEWRKGSTTIGDALVSAGYTQTELVSDEKHANGVALFSVGEHLAVGVTPPDALRGELLLARTKGVCILGVYFPQKQAKSVYFKRCTELIAGEKGPALLIGDLNTGCEERDVEPGGSGFYCEREFLNLTVVHGLTDLWRSQNGDQAREWTWRSTKNGFRIDHAFANRAFLDMFPHAACRMDHSPRESGISDHSALIVDFNDFR